ncbi:MAG: thermonuclease family protein [Candidatus Omnitrophota bacterium]
MKRLFGILFCLLTACANPNDYSHIRVVEVVDGDTVRLANGKLLRYIGIDTPEIHIKQNNRFLYAPQPFAQEAKKYNAKLVANKFVTIEFDVEKTDIYGRLLGYCFVNGVLINAKMLEEGFAVTYTIPPNVKYVDTFVKLQREAQHNKKGFWGAYEVIQAEEAYRYSNQIRTIRGKVQQAHASKKYVSLTLTSHQKNGFRVRIYNNSLENFLQKGIDPLTFYINKTIEVSGRVRHYKTTEIIANTPSDIQIIGE